MQNFRVEKALTNASKTVSILSSQTNEGIKFSPVYGTEKGFSIGWRQIIKDGFYFIPTRFLVKKQTNAKLSRTIRSFILSISFRCSLIKSCVADTFTISLSFLRLFLKSITSMNKVVNCRRCPNQDSALSHNRCRCYGWIALPNVSEYKPLSYSSILYHPWFSYRLSRSEEAHSTS